MSNTVESNNSLKKKHNPQPHHHVIDYNKDLEFLLKDNAEECESLGILHRASFEKYNRLSNYINIPVIILSSAIGFATGIDIGYEKMNIILGIGSIFVGIIKSIDTYFQLGKRSESHRLCSLQYQQVYKKIQIELALKRPQRQTAKDMMAVIKTDIKNLQDISPLIDQDIIDAYNEKYGKYTTVKKPNFVNGLTEVIVNDSGDGDGGDVLHSRSRSESGSLDGNENDSGDGGGGGGGGGGGDGGGGKERLARAINDAIKIDAFGNGGSTQNDLNAWSTQSTPSHTAVANLVFKNQVRNDEPLQQLSLMHQLQQMQQMQQLQQFSGPLPDTIAPIVPIVPNVPIVSSVPIGASVNKELSRPVSSHTSRAPSGSQTPKFEYAVVTAATNEVVDNTNADENEVVTNNVFVTVVPDEKSYDDEGMM
jgi:hypothetical protein